MQKITVLCVGKLKERFYQEAAAEYVKRLGRHCKLDVVELPESRLPEDPSPGEIQRALAAEAAAIREKLPRGGAVIALCIEGKPCSSVELSRRMQELVRRLNRGKDFPHEIGLFLGYPAEDVSGFIRHGARCAKCVGTWKVYGDEESARKKFALYQKCTRLYCEAYRKHNNLDRLLVRTHGS